MLKRYMKIVFLALGFLLIAVSAFSATIVLKDGTVLNGIIVDATDESVVIDTTIGLVEVPQYKIQDIIQDGESGAEKSLETTSGTVSRSIVIRPQGNGAEELIAEMNERDKQIEEKKTRLYFMLYDKEFREKMGIYEMQRIAGDIPYSDRLAMYMAFKRKDQMLGTGFNFFVPSLGSWLQGDVTGALIQDGLLLLGAGLLYWNGNFDYENNTFYNNENGQSDMMLYAGATILIADWIFGIIRPFTFVKKWNKQIAYSLRISATALDKGYDPGPYDTYGGYSSRGGDTQIQVNLLSFEY